MKEEMSPALLIQRIRRFYTPLFERLYDNPQVRLGDLDQLEMIASNYRSSSQFITDLTLDPPNSTQDLPGKPMLDEDYLILSTIHSAKGCEWDCVYLIHAADGMMPSDMATGSEEEIEEERRLVYVAMTRAKDALTIFFPLRYYFRPHNLSDGHTYAQLSRFLSDLGPELFERVRAGRAAEEQKREEEDVVQSGAQAVDQMLKDLWED